MYILFVVTISIQHDVGFVNEEVNMEDVIVIDHLTKDYGNNKGVFDPMSLS